MHDNRASRLILGGATAVALMASTACVVSPKAPDGLALDPNGAGFGRLPAPQQALVADLAREACGDCTPAQHYASWPVSRQTTFEAAMHGLTETLLTGEDGRDLGRAIDLVARVERVAGEEKGRRGDEQFRLYVQLSPDAVSTIAASREFYRDKDNTVYHKGYPVNYRLRGRFPSLQISTTEDGTRADIDVDYLSSKVPQGLFNGHLTAANSDVRVRSNERRHARRWDGLVVWWKSLLEFLLPPAPARETARAEPPAPSSRSVEFERVADASAEFLADWIVRRQIADARAFLSPHAALCANVDDDAENERAGAAPTREYLEDLMDAAIRGRRPARLSDVIQPVAPWDPDLKVQPHPFDGAYTIATTDAADAAAFVCAAGQAGVAPADAWAQVLFQLQTPGADGGAVIALLWAQEGRAWRIRSADVIDH